MTVESLGFEPYFYRVLTAMTSGSFGQCSEQDVRMQAAAATLKEPDAGFNQERTLRPEEENKGKK